MCFTELASSWVPLREQHRGRGAGKLGHSRQLNETKTQNTGLEVSAPGT